MNLLGHQQIAELAVLVGLISIERAYAVHHGRPWPLVNALHRAESCRLANPPTSSGWVVHLRGGDDDGSGAVLQSFNQELMGQMVHRKGEFNALLTPTG